MSAHPPSLSLGVGLSVVAMVVCLVLVTYDDPVAPSNSASATTMTSPSPTPKQDLVEVAAPKIIGDTQYGKSLEHTLPEVSESQGVTFSSQWMRNGEVIPDETDTSYRIRAADVGQTISAAVTAEKAGFAPVTSTSAATEEITHAAEARTTVKYQIATRGDSSTDLESFRSEVAQILDDPRGWRSDGISFKEVESGAPMTIFLATAETLPSFSSHCSPNWSCRAGANVVINQNRWENATDTWKAQDGTTITAYRHMVVNHEVGHWLGLSHQGCGTPGKPAPLMMQQSKGLNGCEPNPWPLDSEKNPPRFR